MNGATILFSGGLDSATLLAHMLVAGQQPHALAIDYGQRHAARELQAAITIAAHYRTPLHVLPLEALAACSPSSALTSGMPVPDGHYTAETMAATVVPNRNAILLSIAAAIAASKGHGYVATAVHAGDHHIYADCRPEFIAAIDRATQLSAGVRILAPFSAMTKTQIAELARRLGVPVGLTWSCYRGGPLHCGRCGTCVERAEALALVGEDPTAYAHPTFWRTTTAEGMAR